MKIKLSRPKAEEEEIQSMDCKCLIPPGRDLNITMPCHNHLQLSLLGNETLLLKPGEPCKGERNKGTDREAFFFSFFRKKESNCIIEAFL